MPSVRRRSKLTDRRLRTGAHTQSTSWGIFNGYGQRSNNMRITICLFAGLAASLVMCATATYAAEASMKRPAFLWILGWAVAHDMTTPTTIIGQATIAALSIRRTY